MSSPGVKKLNVSFREIRRDASTSKGYVSQAMKAERGMRARSSRSSTTNLDKLSEAVARSSLKGSKCRSPRKELKFSSKGKPYMTRARCQFVSPPVHVACRSLARRQGMYEKKKPVIDRPKMAELDGKLNNANRLYVKGTMKMLASAGRLQGGRVLFVGSGCSKINLDVFNSSPSRVVFLDCNKEACDTMASHLTNMGYAETGRVVWGTMQHLDEEFQNDDKFDVIIAMKSVGMALASDPDLSLSQLLLTWGRVLADDGVLLVDNLFQVEKDVNELCDTRKLRNFFRDPVQRTIATNCGKFNDRVYSIGMSVRNTGTMHVEMMWDPVGSKIDHTGELLAQHWCQCVIKKNEPAEPIQSNKRESHIVERVSRPFHFNPDPNGPSLMPTERKYSCVSVPGSRGRKLTPTDNDADMYTDPCHLPKFDGQMGFLDLSEGRLAFTSANLRKMVRHNMGIAKHKILCQAELLEARKRNGPPPKFKVYIVMVTGIVSVNGAPRDVNRIENLAILKPFAKVLEANGVLVTNSLYSSTIVGDECCVWIGDHAYMVSVDGLNVPINGRYGNFLKPFRKMTIDCKAQELHQKLLEAARSNLWFTINQGSTSLIDMKKKMLIESSLPDAKPDDVLEYECEEFPLKWRAVRVRADKLMSVSRVRAIFDFNNLFMSMLYKGVPSSSTTESLLVSISNLTIRPGEFDSDLISDYKPIKC